jgi:D-methionine transport system permease protein
MAGAIGAGGLGDLAIRYGYQRFDTQVMIEVIVVLIVMVCGIQWIGDRIVSRVDKRHA